MKLICLETKAFYQLVDEVVGLVQSFVFDLKNHFVNDLYA